MSNYISLLRGINVSGQKKVNMQALKALYESLGLKQVTTYIQSGNVVFSCNDKSPNNLKVLLEASIVRSFGFEVPVLVLSETTLNNALKQLPFTNISVTEQGNQVIFSFLSSVINTDKIALLNNYLIEGEELASSIDSNNSLDTNVIYLHCLNGYGKTKLSNTFLEKTLDVTATSRNLKTVIKLCELAKKCHV
jgi:uncharacterized protein (DUF1697 family)